MANYDLSILCDTEFEELAKDILSSHLKLDFKTFRSGRDKGIDLLYSKDDEETIVQVKHYIKSTFSNLRTVIKEEYKKMCDRNPKRYILFVSMDLSVNQCDQITKIMNGYIKSASDIYDLKRIISLLSNKKNAWIEEKYYKLWLTNTSVISNILHNAQQNNIKYMVEQIREDLPLYVITNNYYISREKLEKSGLLLIHGEPGVGKTVLANLLVLQYLEAGYKPKFIIGHNIPELENILSRDKDEKEIIFIDDFLGSNFVELINGNNENRLVSFIRKYLHKPNKRVVLTSRTTIYNRASLVFEKLHQLEEKINLHSIEVKSYNQFEKAAILYNHCYFLLNDREYFNEIVKDKRYMRIIYHKNYNPRIIEFFADKLRLNDVDVKNYYSFIMDKLNNPEDIWRYEYESKITNEERLLVDTLLTFNQSSQLEYLERAFEKRYSYEIKENSFTRSHNTFNKALKVLDAGFIRIDIGENNKRLVSFINPSIRDFLKFYFRENPSEVSRIINGIKFIDQLLVFNSEGVSSEGLIDLTEEHIENIRQLLINDFNDIEEIGFSKMLYITKFSNVLPNPDEEIEKIQYNYLEKVIENEKFSHLSDVNSIYEVLNSRHQHLRIKELIFQNVKTVTALVLKNTYLVEELASWLGQICCLEQETCKMLLQEDFFINDLREILNINFEMYFEERSLEYFKYEDYITYNGYADYDFDLSSIETDIFNFIEEFKDQSVEFIRNAIPSIYGTVEKRIKETIDSCDYKQFINCEKLIEDFESSMHDYPDYDYDDDIYYRDTGYSEGTDLAIDDMFEGSEYRS